MIDFGKIDKIANLLLAERDHVLTGTEKSELDKWLKEDARNQILYDSLKKEESIPAKLKILEGYNKEKAFAKFVKRAKDKKTIKIKRFLRYAALLIPFFLAVYFIYQHNSNVEPELQTISDIQPGTSKAILELADGSTVNLEKEDKEIMEYDGTIVQNTQKQLIYKPADQRQNHKKIRYNTIKIPRGGEYQLSLSDGTKVWLNAETILKYPVVFSDKTREIFMEGEAFFEVAKSTDWPFIVHTSNVKVNVLGTSFNIRAYSDEKVSTTTLVTGKVTLVQSDNNKEYGLTPNEQATVSKGATVIEKVNVNQFIAWKNGRILFEENTLEEIFNELSRWYNIDINYADEEVKNLRFSIDVVRYSKFETILEIIELTKKVKFEINENEVTIMKNK
tara:strand:+ start:2503 stop:3675 length:1173 start_codon:yes stop_codon:yes gene_type:complete